MDARKLRQILLSLMLLMAICQVSAQVYPPAQLDLSRNLYGRTGSLKKDSLATSGDSIYAETAYQAMLIKPYPIKDIITLKIEQDSFHLAQPFTAKVRFRITYWYTVDSSKFLDTALTVTYHTGNSGLDSARSSFVFSGAYKVRVRVLRDPIITGTTDTNAVKVLVLENRVVSQPNYVFNCTDNVIKKLNLTTVAGADEIRASWANVWGADEYDLEWAYIDSSALLNSALYTGYTTNRNKLFEYNATRVTVKTLDYNIPLIYDSAGVLFVRVRPVMGRDDGSRVEVRWSSDYAAGTGAFGFTGHENSLNWQSTISFAEDGKRKVVVQYYDGSLRSRQTVTKDNSTNTTVVAETFYDYQGRPVLQVLPAPTINNIVQYSRNFNRNISNLEYDKDQYDPVIAANAYCNAGAAPMSKDSSGASMYYSISNPDKSQSNKFIPDAQRYPFTETEYTQDNTGRIARQSGVGTAFRLGNGHETKYYYGGAPDQAELDALFGTEAGDHNHYQKNMVRDANGQFSVSYVDMRGRTIATALAGTVPDNLDTLSSYKTDTVTEVLTDRTGTIIRDLVMESKKSLLVDMQGPFEFKYDLDPESLTKAACNGANVCYDCLYDLQITITDDCNNQKIGQNSGQNGKAFDTLIHNFSLLSFDSSGQCKDSGFHVKFTKNLEPGNYEVTKRLIVSKASMDMLRDSVFMKKNLCITLDSMIRQQARLNISTECVGNEIPDTTEGDNILIRQAMLLDMTAPSGQYANPGAINAYSIFYAEGDSSYPYQKTNLVYLDENGNRDTVYDDRTGSYVIPQQLDIEQFIDKFKTSWADALLKYHPEYCKLAEYDKYASTLIWERKFRKVETYQEAYGRGFLDPTGISSRYPNPASGEGDPLAGEASINSRINNYVSAGSGYKSLWVVSSAVVKCTDPADTDCALNMSDSDAFDNTWCEGDLDMAWRSFREQYLVIHRNFIDQKVTAATCPGSLGLPFVFYTRPVTTAQLIDSGQHPNFYTAEEAFTLDPNNDFAGFEDTTQIKNGVNAYLEDNCKAYASYWAEQLSPCTYTTQELNDSIIPRLTAVCIGGADIDHPYGSREIKPGTTAMYSSFDDVINDYNSRHPRPFPIDKTACNADLITSPLRYDQQVSYSGKPVWTKPTACECEKITQYHNEYLSRHVSLTFSQYMLQRYNTSMSETDLDALLAGCDTSLAPACTYLKQPVNLPPAFQCYTGDVCISCNQMSDAYNGFISAYGNVVVTKDNNDSAQNVRNQLFENYMNNTLGFKKQAAEYLAFMDTCGISASFANFCDTIYTTLASFGCYYSSLKDSLVHTGECNQRYWTVGAKSNFTFKSVNTPSQFVNPAGSGTLYFRSDMDTLLRGQVSYKLVRPICVNNRFTIEFSVKNDLSGCTSGTNECGRGDVGFGFGNVASGPLPPENFYFNFVQNNNANGGYTYKDVSTSVAGLKNRSFSSFQTVKLEVSTDSFKVFYGSTLAMSKARNANDSIMQLTSLDFTLWGNSRFIDWVKVYRPNNPSTPVFFEDFTSITNMARPDTNALCNRLPCDEEFAKFYNERNNTNYTPAQLSQKYLDSCGLILNPCQFANVLLCGKAEPVFPPGTLDTVDNCSDSAFFSYSIGTELYKNYRDSLKNNFDSSYRAKCLQAYKYESFTVKHVKAEYHYTLYYYDQAGNLVKTVPPEGVKRITRQSWLDSVAMYRQTKPSSMLRVEHTLATRYTYNSLNQVIAQKTPDAGESGFYYDRLGRLVLSQNSKQAPAKKFSYTFYDYLGRISEVGELANDSAMRTTRSRNADSLKLWFTATALNARTQITKTVYDRANTLLVQWAPRNLRSRVAYTALFDAAADLASLAYATATYYSYDFHGNVDTLMQDYGSSLAKPNVMNSTSGTNSNRFKKIVYQYDLISGKVNWVGYQPGQVDAFYHRYIYDAENRLTDVETTKDSLYWNRDASYDYYKHGPLSRMVLGDQRVQGVDYAYTIQGWLKGVNSTAPWNFDMRNDGAGNTTPARNAFGFALHYYNGDYTPIGSVRPFAEAGTVPNFRGLYNGNIAAMTVYQPKLANATLPSSLLYNYRYDQLNRLTGMQPSTGLDTSTGQNVWPAMPTLVNHYKESVRYDANGNIQKYNRYGGTGTIMDSLSYAYAPGANKLTQVSDVVAAASFSGDIDDQGTNNYRYDSIGNLTKDVKEGIDTIYWNVYGKITQINKPNTTIKYTYDAAGNRISKAVINAGNTVTTWYTRDASGNVMSVYVKNDPTLNNNQLTQSEVHLYGSSRLGIWQPAINVENPVAPGVVIVPNAGNGYFNNFELGRKLFELSNHLGNVMVTVSDRKFGVEKSNSNKVDYYVADVKSASDYYPGGMTMPGRSYTASSSSYRYGFNGKEIDPNIASEDYDYGMRIYDARVVRFLSVDPITKQYPELTPYQFASNSPIRAIDLDGLEAWDLSTPSANLKRNAEAIQAKLQKPKSTDIEIMVWNPYRNHAQIGPASVVKDNIAIAKQNYYNAIGDNIAGGPVGAIGYIWKGDKGSFAGAAVDQILFSFGGVPGEGYLSKPYSELKQEFVPYTSTKPFNTQLSLSKFNTLDELASQFFFRTPENSIEDFKANGWIQQKNSGSLSVFEKVMGKDRYYAIWEPQNIEHSTDGKPTSYWKLTKGKKQATSEENVRRVSTSFNFKQKEKK